VLREMAQFGTEGFVFPGLKTTSALSDVGLIKAVHIAGGNGATVHGFRSTFRDWCAEATNYPRELAEAAWRMRSRIRPKRRISAAICWRNGGG
jgi:integrase